VTVDTSRDLYIRDKHFKRTRGLGITNSKKVNSRLVSEVDLKQYKSILDLTTAHLEGYEPSAPIRLPRNQIQP